MIPRSEILTILNLSVDSTDDLDDIQLNAVYMIAEGVLNEQQRAMVIDWAMSAMPKTMLNVHLATNSAEIASHLSMMLDGYLKAHCMPH
jgi:hypothetical protein